jgi:hypothetical protein
MHLPALAAAIRSLANDDLEDRFVCLEQRPIWEPGSTGAAHSVAGAAQC